MKTWMKPSVREQEVGLEVTSYLPLRSTSSKTRSKRISKATAGAPSAVVFYCPDSTSQAREVSDFDI